MGKEKWKETTLGQIAQVVGGGTPKSSDPTNFSDVNGVPWLTPKDLSGYSDKYISHGERFLSQKGLDSSSAKMLPKGAVLFTSRAPIGYVAIASNDICTNQGFKSFVLNGTALSEYVYYYLIYARKDLQEMGSGTTFKEISGSVARTIPIPLPPLDEQKRIVAKLDAILPAVKKAKARLERIPGILKKFRQSVLGAACGGRLTEEWREGDVFEFDPRDLNVQDGPKELPDSWAWIELGEVSNGFQYGTSSKSTKEGKVPVLRMGNLQNGAIDWGDLKYTDNASDIKKYNLAKGDVLFNRTNSPDLVGKTSIYDGNRPAIFAGYLIRINYKPEYLNPFYLNFCLNTERARDWCKQVKTDGVSQSNINAQILSTFLVPLPPIEEQGEIVCQVRRLFAIADKLEGRYATAMANVERIEQGVLSKAFAGELV